MKPILHLLGDRYKAQSFVWFAERKLDEMKKVMGLINTRFGNKLYSLPNGDVTVYIESYLGNDKIRIVAKKKEVACDINFIGDVLSGSSPLFVTFTPDDISATYYHVWDYGDGAENYINSVQPQVQPTTHNYHVAGSYTVKGSFSTSPIWVNVPFTNIRSSYKESGGGFNNNISFTTELAAWNDYNARSFTLSVPPVAQPGIGTWHFLENQSSLSWKYRSRKSMADIDLTAYDGSRPIIIFIGFEPNSFDGVTEIPGAGSGGWKSSLGGSVDRLFKTATDIFSTEDLSYYRLLDITAFAGTILTDVEFTDNTDFARKTGPFTFGNNTNYGYVSSAARFFKIFEIQAFECSKTKTNYITVT